jgi:arrestin-related trafficking adapter 4/5/7
VFFDKTWKFRDAGKGKTEVLPADNYEFPFDIVLEGSLPESVEGLRDAWVTYRFKAEIGRKYAKDIVIRKPLRIIRTLDPSALELVHAMVSTYTQFSDLLSTVSGLPFGWIDHRFTII